MTCIKKQFNREENKKQRIINEIKKQLTEARLLNSTVEEEIPIALTLPLDENTYDTISFVTTNKTPYVLCAVDFGGLDTFHMISDNAALLWTNAEKYIDEYMKLHSPYVKLTNDVIANNKIPLDECTKLSDIYDVLSYQKLMDEDEQDE